MSRSIIEPAKPTLPHIISVALAAFSGHLPSFYGFMWKTARQTLHPIPQRFKLITQSTLKSAPTSVGSVAFQVTAQEYIEHKGQEYLKFKPGFGLALSSSLIVGICSVPMLAVLNGQTRGWSIVESMQRLSLKQSGAILTRETAFVLSLQVSQRVSRYMQVKLGENKGVEYGSLALTSMFGSMCGHAADSALTLWQEQMRIEGWRSLLRGAISRSIAVTIFSVVYHVSQNEIKRCGIADKIYESVDSFTSRYLRSSCRSKRQL